MVEEDMEDTEEFEAEEALMMDEEEEAAAVGGGGGMNKVDALAARCMCAC